MGLDVAVERKAIALTCGGALNLAMEGVKVVLRGGKERRRRNEGRVRMRRMRPGTPSKSWRRTQGEP